METRLSALRKGDVFWWSGTRFALRDTVAVSFSGDPRPHLRVVYMDDPKHTRDGEPPWRAGDRGLMPADEMVEPYAEPKP